VLLEGVDYLLGDLVQVFGFVDADCVEEVGLALLEVAQTDVETLGLVADLDSVLVAEVLEESDLSVEGAFLILGVCLLFTCGLRLTWLDIEFFAFLPLLLAGRILLDETNGDLLSLGTWEVEGLGIFSVVLASLFDELAGLHELAGQVAVIGLRFKHQLLEGLELPLQQRLFILELCDLLLQGLELFWGGFGGEGQALHPTIHTSISF
jgi:hypothetical protein